MGLSFPARVVYLMSVVADEEVVRAWVFR